MNDWQLVYRFRLGFCKVKTRLTHAQAYLVFFEMNRPGFGKGSPVT